MARLAMKKGRGPRSRRRAWRVFAENLVPSGPLLSVAEIECSTQGASGKSFRYGGLEPLSGQTVSA